MGKESKALSRSCLPQAAAVLDPGQSSKVTDASLPLGELAGQTRIN